MTVLAAAAALLLASPPAAPYPLEYVVSESAALFHWVDCLASTSAGKTVPLHRQDFLRRFGRTTDAERRALASFARLRSPDMLEAFLAESDRAAALARLPEAERRPLAEVLDLFEPRFRRVWEDGPQAPARGLPRFASGLRSVDLDGTLRRVARFFSVDPSALSPARVVLLPVPDGGGTHAQALGRQLLVEVRPSDRPRDQVAPIVHENAHWLMLSMDPERSARLHRAARAHGERGERALRLLREALPTALAQGVADREHNPGDWSLRPPWYHLPEVDAYAKALYPLVKEALESGRPLDEELLGRMVAVTPPGP